MKAYVDFLKVLALPSIVLCVGTVRGEIRGVDGATFDPPLVPTTNLAETAGVPIVNRVITEDATLTGIELAGVLYTNVQGPTNATTGGTDLYWPVNGTSPGSDVAAITGLTLAVSANKSPYTVMFADEAHANANEGFFLVELGGNDAGFNVYPLGSDGSRIGAWVLSITNTSQWGGNHVLYPHGYCLSLGKGGAATTCQSLGGVAFTLGDFAGGSGVLNHVMGLEIDNSAAGLDLVMAGLYKGPGQSVISLAGRAFQMQSATFSATSGDPITNDYDLVGIGGAASIAAPTNAYPFDGRNTSYLLYPQNGTPPSSTVDALLGFGMNGVRDIGYWDFMFAEPVTNANDGFFIIEEAYYFGPHFVYPLDANRRPISTYAIAALPSLSAWNRQDAPYLMNTLTWWYGSGNGTYEPWGTAGQGKSRPGGIIMPLAAFAGGTGGLTNVYGIRIWHTSWTLDPLVIGSYKARPALHPVYNVELDRVPTPTPGADHVSSTYRDPWTLTSITLDSGRYTDLEGPSKAVLATADWEYCVDDTNPPANAVEAALGLDSSGLMNANNCKWYFDTTVTNGFDGGFFVIVPPDNDFTVLPLGTDSNVIAGFSIAVDNSAHLPQIMEADMGILWTRKYGNPPSATVGRAMRGTSFTLDCFTNSVGEFLTNDVIGLQLTDSPSIDPLMAGIYRGPPAGPVPAPGVALPITAATFTPPVVGSAVYSNDAAVVSVASGESASYSIRAPSSVNVLVHRSSQTYYPVLGTNPDPDGVSAWTDGYTNALYGLSMDGVFNPCMSEFMFDKPVRRDSDGFFVIGRDQSFMVVRPLAADRTPISTYSVQTSYPMYVGSLGLNNFWRMHYDVSSLSASWMKGVMIRKSDFAGGSGDLGLIYGIRIEDASREYFDPAVVGEWFGAPEGTLIRLQ